jgi:hypothetical protein
MSSTISGKNDTLVSSCFTQYGDEIGCLKCSRHSGSDEVHESISRNGTAMLSFSATNWLVSSIAWQHINSSLAAWQASSWHCDV